LYGRIRQLDPSPSFDDAVRQFVMVNFTKKNEVTMMNKTLCEIRPG
jgi:hypothetical protein